LIDCVSRSWYFNNPMTQVNARLAQAGELLDKLNTTSK
jgi:hypothetical protein